MIFSFIPKFARAQQVGAGQIKVGSVSPILIAASLLRRVNWSICPLNINIDVNREHELHHLLRCDKIQRFYNLHNVFTLLVHFSQKQGSALV